MIVLVCFVFVLFNKKKKKKKKKKKPVKTLGMWYSLDPNETYKLNVTEKINTIQSTLKAWQPRCLTLK